MSRAKGGMRADGGRPDDPFDDRDGDKEKAEVLTWQVALDPRSFGPLVRKGYDKAKSFGVRKNSPNGLIGCSVFCGAFLALAFLSMLAFGHYFGSQGQKLTGVLLCDIKLSNSHHLSRGQEVRFRPIFANSIEVDNGWGGFLFGSTVGPFDDRVVSVEGFEAHFEPDQGSDTTQRCDRLLDQRDRSKPLWDITGAIDGYCYDGQTSLDLPIAIGVIEEIESEKRPFLSYNTGASPVVEVRTHNGSVEYRTITSCPNSPEPPPGAKVPLQNAVQKWVDIWLDENPYPDVFEEINLHETLTLVQIGFRDNALFCKHGNTGNEKFSMSVCEMVKDRAYKIIENTRDQDLSNQGKEVIVAIKNPRVSRIRMSVDAEKGD